MAEIYSCLTIIFVIDPIQKYNKCFAISLFMIILLLNFVNKKKLDENYAKRIPFNMFIISIG